MRRNPITFALVAAGLLLSSLAMPRSAWASIHITGTVYDCNNAAVPNVVVVLQRSAAGSSCTVNSAYQDCFITNSDGSFDFVVTMLPADGYSWHWCLTVPAGAPSCHGTTKGTPCCNGLQCTGSTVAQFDSGPQDGDGIVYGPVGIFLQYSGNCAGGGDPGEGLRHGGGRALGQGNWVSVVPNPVQSSAVAWIHSSAPAMGSAAVYDIGGRKVIELLNGRLNSGSTQLRWSSVGLRPGVYTVRFRLGARTTAIPVIILSK